MHILRAMSGDLIFVPHRGAQRSSNQLLTSYAHTWYQMLWVSAGIDFQSFDLYKLGVSI
jgi:hypothetical protein